MIGKPRAASGGTATLERRPPEPAPAPPPPRRAQAEHTPAQPPPARQGVLRTVIGVVVFSVIVVVGLGVLAASTLPVERWMANLFPQTEFTGRVTSVAVEHGTRRLAIKRWRGTKTERLVVRVAPYSFGLAFTCEDTAHCDELRARIARGDTVTARVDKEEFEQFAAANRTVDHKNPKLGQRGQQMVAAAFDERRLRLNRLTRNGEVLLGD